MRHSRAAWLLVVACSSFLYAGCGPADDGAGQVITPSPSPTTTSASPTATNASPTTTASTANPGPIAVPAPQPGPASPDAPDPISWFASLQQSNCAELASLVENAPERTLAVVPLYGALVELCRWLQQPTSPVDWDGAKAALQASSDLESCLDQEAARLLSALVDAHESDPNAQVVLGDAEPGTACPVAVTDVVVFDTETEIGGQYLFEVSEVLIEGQPVVLDNATDNDPLETTLFVTSVPCLQDTPAVEVVVRGQGYTHSQSNVPVNLVQSQEVCESTTTDTPSPS